MQAGRLSSRQHAVTFTCQNKMFGWSNNSDFPSLLVRSRSLPESSGEMIEYYNWFWVERCLLSSIYEIKIYVCGREIGLFFWTRIENNTVFSNFLKEDCVCSSWLLPFWFLTASLSKFNNAFQTCLRLFSFIL